MARLRLDPSSASGFSTEPEKPSYKPYFAGGPGKVSLVDSVAGKHGAVRLELADMDDVTIASAPTDDQVIAYDSATSQFIPQSIAAVSGAGDVDGPASATDNAIARFDGTTGKVIQNSGVTITDLDGLVLPSTTGLDTGGITFGTDTNLYRSGADTLKTDDKIFIDGTWNSGISLRARNVGTGADTYALYGEVTGALNSNFSSAIIAVVGSGVTQAHGLYSVHQGTSGSAFRTWITSGAGVTGLNVLHDNTSNQGASATFSNAGGAFNQGGMIAMTHSNTGVTQYVRRTVTNKNDSTAGKAYELEARSTVTDGATYTKSGSVFSITSNVTETSGTITDSAIVLDINQTHADATGTVVDIDNDGTGNALAITQDGTLAAFKYGILLTSNTDNGNSAVNAFRLTSNTAHTSGIISRALAFLVNDNASSIAQVLGIQQDGSGVAFNIDNNNTGTSINIDHDASSASSITGVVIDVDNASTGGAIGLDISNVTATSGTVIGQRIALPSGGTANYALQLSDTGGTAAGGIHWATDTNLYRSAANVLKTDDRVLVTDASNGLISVQVNSTITTGTSNARGLKVDPTFVNTAGSGPGGIEAAPTFAPLANITNAYGLINLANGNPDTGITITNIYGGYYRIDTGNGAGAITNAYAMAAENASLGSLKPTNLIGLKVFGQGESGVSTAIGIDVNATTGSSTNIGVRIAKGDTYSLQLSSTAGDAASGITFGVDTTLYRSAADTLKTDDKLHVVGELEVDGALNHDGTNVGLYGVAPVARATTGVAEAAFTENAGGTAVNVDSTFGGYTMQQVVQALQNIGLLT